MRIGGRGRQSTRKDTDQTKELAAKKESADTKKGRSTRKEPGGKNDRGGILSKREGKNVTSLISERCSNGPGWTLQNNTAGDRQIPELAITYRRAAEGLPLTDQRLSLGLHQDRKSQK